MSEGRTAAGQRGWTGDVADATAFRSWYDETLPRVYSYLYARCDGDPALAEELTQQTFIAVVDAHHAFRGDADLLTWVLVIARRKLADHFRREKRVRARHDQLTARFEAASSETGRWDSHAAWDEVRRALDALSGEQRIAFVLRHVDGLSVRDVAAAIGRSEDATESLLRRARRSFDDARSGTPR